MIEQRILMALLIGGVVVGCVLVLYPFLSALLWAGILVFTTWPVHEWIRARLRLRRSAAALVMVGLTAVILVLPSSSEVRNPSRSSRLNRPPTRRPAAPGVTAMPRP